MFEQVLMVASLSFQLEIAQMKVKVSRNHIAVPLVFLAHYMETIVAKHSVWICIYS